MSSFCTFGVFRGLEVFTVPGSAFFFPMYIDIIANLPDSSTDTIWRAISAVLTTRLQQAFSRMAAIYRGGGGTIRLLVHSHEEATN